MKDKKDVKRFKSCFICDVEVHDDQIILEDSRSNQYVIYKSEKEAVESFVWWFKNVYMKCIPQSLVVVNYRIEPKNDNEAVCVVNKLTASSSFVEEDDVVEGA